MFGQVVEIGKSVTTGSAGRFCYFHRPARLRQMFALQMNRSDMCQTGEYSERGIWGLDGYQTEYVVDKEQYVVHVPANLETVGVLCEPLSVAEKAIDESRHCRRRACRTPRQHWIGCTSAHAWWQAWARSGYWRRWSCACAARWSLVSMWWMRILPGPVVGTHRRAIHRWPPDCGRPGG